MASETDRDTSRTVVKTYVPADQRDEWDRAAEERGMSRSEFVRTMVQAGKRGFDEYASSGEDTTEESTPGEPDPRPKTADELDELVIETLSDDEYLSWDRLLTAVTDDIESRLEETLQSLQDENRVRYSGRNGGYTLQE